MDQNTNAFDTDSGRGPATASTSVDIPVLKPKKEERKGAGIVLPGSTAAGQSLAGGAAAGGLKALVAGKLGAAALALGVGGAGLVGYGVWQQSARPAQPAPSAGPNLAPIEPSVSARKRDSQGSKSLAFMARASGGELKWEDPNAPKNAAAPAQKAEAAEAAAEEPAVPDAREMINEALAKGGVEAGQESKMGRISGAKLSKQLGGSNAFGSKSIFSGGTGFDAKGMKNLDGKKTASFKPASQRGGKAAALRRGAEARLAKKIDTRGVTAQRAVGQLKFAEHRSMKAANVTGSEAGATGAQQAFDSVNNSGQTGDGTGGAIGSEFPDVAAPGSGAPDVTASGGTGNGLNFSNCPEGYVASPDGGCMVGGNATPYQNLVDSGKSMAETAKMLLMIGMVLLALFWIPTVGPYLAAIGATLIILGLVFQAQVRNNGDAIKSNYGQNMQGKILERQGTNAGNRAFEDAGPRNHDWKDNVQHDVATERDSTYTE